jgi:LAO/AO transport system kinase
MNASGEFSQRRSQQQVKWMWSIFEDRTKARLRNDPAIRAEVTTTETAVAEGRVTPALGASHIAELLR